MAQIGSCQVLKGKLQGQKLRKPQSHLNSSGKQDNHPAKDKGTARALSAPMNKKHIPAGTSGRRSSRSRRRSLLDPSLLAWPGSCSQEEMATSCLFYLFPAAFCLQSRFQLARLPAKTQTIKTYMLTKQDLKSSPSFRSNMHHLTSSNYCTVLQTLSYLEFCQRECSQNLAWLKCLPKMVHHSWDGAADCQSIQNNRVSSYMTR